VFKQDAPQFQLHEDGDRPSLTPKAVGFQLVSECRQVSGIPAFAGGSWTLAGDLAVERARAWSTAIPWFSIRSL